jgi:hypothetical protein
MNLSLTPVFLTRWPPAGLLRRALLPLVGLALIAVGCWLFLHSRGAGTYRVNMLSDLEPNRALLAERIAAEARRHGLEVALSSRPHGALEAIELVDEPNPIDLALVPGGVARREHANVRQVAALSPEPLQVLARAELASGGVGRLKGRRVCLGPPASSIHFLARDVLAFAGLHAPAAGYPGDYLPQEGSPHELEQQLNHLRDLVGTERDRALAALPDAIFLLSTLPSILARDLVVVAGYRLVTLPFADAYCLDRIRPTETGEVRIDRALFAATEIPAYTYSVEPAVPDKPCRTIAIPLLLIAQAPTDPEGVARLLETVFDGPVAGLARPLPLREQMPPFPFHAGVERYLRRSDPLLTPEQLSVLVKMGGGFGACVSGVMALYGFVRMRQLRRFESYYHEIRRLELVARGQEADPAAPSEPASRRAYLEERLLDLKSRALQDFANGGLKGEGLMWGIVSLVNDTRCSLDRMASPAPREELPSLG